MPDGKTYGYLFEVGYDENGPHVRYGMDVSGCVSDEYREAIKVATVASKAAERIGADTVSSMAYKRKVLMDVIKRDKLEGPLARAGLMFTRARITGGSLHMFISEVPLSFDEVDKVLKWHAKVCTLKTVLEKSRVV